MNLQSLLTTHRIESRISSWLFKSCPVFSVWLHPLWLLNVNAQCMPATASLECPHRKSHTHSQCRVFAFLWLDCPCPSSVQLEVYFLTRSHPVTPVAIFVPLQPSPGTYLQIQMDPLPSSIFLTCKATICIPQTCPQLGFSLLVRYALPSRCTRRTQKWARRSTRMWGRGSSWSAGTVVVSVVSFLLEQSWGGGGLLLACGGTGFSEPLKISTNYTVSCSVCS